MPPADHVLPDVPDVPAIQPVRQPRSPRLVRSLLLGAFGVGMLGLALPLAAPAATSLAVSPAASSSYVTEVPERPEHRTAALAAAPLRASRSRALAAKAPVRTTVTTRHAATGSWVRPSAAGIVSPYGMRWGRMHKGVDFGAHYGSPIRAIGDGVVIGAGYLAEESGYGQITLIRHANGFVSAYAHQSSMLVHAGDRVSAGDVIGYVGATGHVTGPHLHFEIRTATHSGQINPLPWLRSHGVSV